MTMFMFLLTWKLYLEFFIFHWTHSDETTHWINTILCGPSVFIYIYICGTVVTDSGRNNDNQSILDVGVKHSSVTRAWYTYELDGEIKVMLCDHVDEKPWAAKLGHDHQALGAKREVSVRKQEAERRLLEEMKSATPKWMSRPTAKQISSCSTVFFFLRDDTLIRVRCFCLHMAASEDFRAHMALSQNIRSVLHCFVLQFQFKKYIAPRCGRK